MSKVRGFTLVELLITLAVAIVLAAVIVPGFQSLRENNLAMTEVNKLVAAFNLARSEAVGRGRQVNVCAAVARSSWSDPPDPATDCAATGGSDWRNGWLIYEDGSNILLRAGEGFTATPNITFGGALVAFSAQGTLAGGGSLYCIDLDWANGTGMDVRRVSVTGVGQVQLVRANTARSSCA